jgi:hypothetical protein
VPKAQDTSMATDSLPILDNDKKDRYTGKPGKTNLRNASFHGRGGHFGK